MKAKLGEEKYKEEPTALVHDVRIDSTETNLGKGKGITFAPGQNVLVEPLLSSGAWSDRDRGRLCKLSVFPEFFGRCCRH